MQKKFTAALLVVVIFVLLALVSVRMQITTPVFTYAEEQKQVYLTFDDGPSTVVTNRVLDVLKEEGIKATFFIVSDRARTREDTLKRVANEGHTLGVHSASHDYGKIYSSMQALLSDADECAAFIKKTTGITPRVYRFPGGGKLYRAKESEALEKRGYKIVEWNAVNGDEEISGASAKTLYETAISSSEGKNPVVLLMHDSAPHKETAAALPGIISYFRGKGYEFCAF